MGTSKKTGKDDKSIANKHLHARVSYLHQAATFLASNRRDFGVDLGAHGLPAKCAQKATSTSEDCPDLSCPELAADHTADQTNPKLTGQAQHRMQACKGDERRLLAHLRAVSRRGKVPLTTSSKRSICKRCDGLLVVGDSCQTATSNPSRHQRKPWVDIAVYTCQSCGCHKRFPFGSKRKRPKGSREMVSSEV